MNELTEIGALNSALARRYGAQSPLIHTMASDAFPVVPVSDSQLDPELHWLAGSRLCSAHITSAADVANQSSVGLRNPSGSGVIAVIERIDLFTGAAATCIITMATITAPTGSQQGFFRDGRGWPATPLRASCDVVSLAGAFSSTLGRVRISNVTDQQYTHLVSYILNPGERLTIAPLGVNTAIDGTFYWRERRIVSQEQGE